MAKQKLEEVTVQGWESTKTYIHGGVLVVRISEVPEHQRNALDKFIVGQTMPLVEGKSVQDFVYLHDYENFLHKHKTGREMFWD